MRKCFSEFLGTFGIVFAGTGAIVVNHVSNGTIGHAGIALTFGLVVMAMIYAFAPISGAHLNPAVTLGFYAAGKFPGSDIPKYMLSQFGGALLASLLLLALFGNRANLGATLPSGSDMQSFILEFSVTGLLMLVILCVSTGSKETGTMAGIAVGGVIAFEAMFAGPISGASMNPARSLAPALVSGHLESLWIYETATFLGALAGVGCWKLLRETPVDRPV